MKFTTSILLIALIASMNAYKLRADDGVHTEAAGEETNPTSVSDVSTSTESASTGVCTKGSCAYCNKDGDAKYCTMCYKKNITGTGSNGQCSGSAPTGCIGTMMVNDLPTCMRCDDKNNYHMVNSNCVKCDLSSNYLSGSECKKVTTTVSNCASYKSATECQICKSGYQLQENVCNKLPSNCAFMDADKKCMTCNPKYMLKDSACTSITIKNCETVSLVDNTKCQACASGYYVKDGACASIGVSNCVNGTEEKKCDLCNEGYLLKDDGSACTSSSSCIQAVYESSIQCVQCNFSNGYFATDVKGDATITYQGSQKWEQVCTKFSKIASAAFIAALFMTLF